MEQPFDLFSCEPTDECLGCGHSWYTHAKCSPRICLYSEEVDQDGNPIFICPCPGFEETL